MYGFHWFQFCFILDHHSWLSRLYIRSSFLWLKELTCTLNISLVAQMVKNLPAMQETEVWSLGWEDPLEKGVAIHSSILAWRIPWTEEPGGLQSMGSQRVTQDWAMFTYFFIWPPHPSSPVWNSPASNSLLRWPIQSPSLGSITMEDPWLSLNSTVMCFWILNFHTALLEQKVFHFIELIKFSSLILKKK